MVRPIHSHAESTRRKTHKALSILTAAFLMTATLSVKSAVQANPIEIIQTGTGTGSIGSNVFSNAAFTITSFSDTSTQTTFNTFDTISRISNTSSSINISGLGTFQFQTETNEFVNNTTATVGFERDTAPPPLGTDLFDGPTNSAFTTWSMLSSIGPITGTGQLLQWANPPVQTDGGTLSFSSNPDVPTTFQAIVTLPEPTFTFFLAIFAFPLLGRARSGSDRKLKKVKLKR